MTKRDRRRRRTVTLAPNAQVVAPVMAEAHTRVLDLTEQAVAVQTAALNPDGDAFRIVHHPTPEAEVSGWVWTEPPNGGGRGRVGLWALGCGHCGTTHCAHIDATLQQLDQVLSAAPSPETWRVAGGDMPTHLAQRARRAAESHHERQIHSRADRDASYERAIRRIGSLSPDTPIPYLRENVTGGAATRDGGRPFSLTMTLRLEPDTPPDRDCMDLALSLRQELLAVAPNAEWTASPYYVGGEVRCHIASDRLYDDHGTWTAVEAVCDILQRHGAVADPRGTLVVAVEPDPVTYDISDFNRLYHATRHNEDLLARVGSVPGAGTPGRFWGVSTPERPNGYTSLQDAEDDYSTVAERPLSITVMPDYDGYETVVLEVRGASGTVDPGRLQANINTALGLLTAAEADGGPSPHTPRGTYHRLNSQGRSGLGQRSARAFAEAAFSTPEQVDQFAAMYATTDWQPPPDRR